MANAYAKLLKPSYFIKRRQIIINPTPAFKLYHWQRIKQLEKHNIAAVQKQQLLNLLKAAKSTQFGKAYHFARIKTVAAYQSAVPLRTYQNFWDDYWAHAFPELINCTWHGKNPYFAISGGTTGVRGRSIPVSKTMVAANKKASLDLFCHHFSNKPDSQLLGGKGFLAAGLTPVKPLAKGVYTGVLPSIILQKTMPWWIKPYYLLATKEIITLPTWSDRLTGLAQLALTENIHSLSGFPSTLLSFFNKLQAAKGLEKSFRLVDYFPNLEMLTHGGVSFTPYQAQFKKILEGSHCELRELYSTSEGLLAIADRQPGQGLRLNYDHGIFFEFVPIEEVNQPNPQSFWLDNVEIGIDYAIVLSTCAGLWRYYLGDTIKFVDLTPPRLLITGRSATTLSLYGEKISEESLCQAIVTATETIGSQISEFTVGIHYPQNTDEAGRYIYIIEFKKIPEKKAVMNHFSTLITKSLYSNNLLYESVHNKGNLLGANEFLVVPPGTFMRWLVQTDKRGEKIPRVIIDEKKFNNFLTFARQAAQK